MTSPSVRMVVVAQVAPIRSAMRAGVDPSVSATTRRITKDPSERPRSFKMTAQVVSIMRAVASRPRTRSTTPPPPVCSRSSWRFSSSAQLIRSHTIRSPSTTDARGVGELVGLVRGHAGATRGCAAGWLCGALGVGAARGHAWGGRWVLDSGGGLRQRAADALSAARGVSRGPAAARGGSAPARAHRLPVPRDGVGSESEGAVLGAAVVVGAAGRGGVSSPAGMLRGLHRWRVRGGSAGRRHLAHALPKMLCGVGVVQRVDDVAEDALQGVGLETERGDGCIDEDGCRDLRPVDLVSGARRNVLQVEAARASVALEVGVDHEQPSEGLSEGIQEFAARHTLEACRVAEVVVHESEEPIDVFRIREAAVTFEGRDDSRAASPFVDVLEQPAVQCVIVAGGEGLVDVGGVVDELGGADGGEAAFDAFEFVGVVDLARRWSCRGGCCAGTLRTGRATSSRPSSRTGSPRAARFSGARGRPARA